MFEKIKTTAFAPDEPLLVWDGKCGFCAYWTTRWQRKTPKEIRFEPFQKTAEKFKDIPLHAFQTSSKLIEPDGSVFNGPDSAYRSLWHAGNKFWHRLYTSNRFFEKLSDSGYNHIAKNRDFYYKLTVFCFGKNPASPKHYWLLYLLTLIILLIILLNVL
ncbi:MAG TPA: DCC1-like thiol-disulfide oxidoreductase family protein [Balneolaceae bacterium]|nr:DCC1-like thiol-disulfide oxidoreductase family protein [Balneolaceae bacterium]